MSFLATYRVCNMVRLEMYGAISPVNPLEDKFLIAISK